MNRFLWLTSWEALPERRPVAVNIDTVAMMVPVDNHPPATRIVFRREEAREHIDVAETMAAIASQFGVQLTGFDEEVGF